MGSPGEVGCMALQSGVDQAAKSSATWHKIESGGEEKFDKWLAPTGEKPKGFRLDGRMSSTIGTAEALVIA